MMIFFSKTFAMKPFKSLSSIRLNSLVRLHSTSSETIKKSQVLGLGPNSKLLKQYKESLGELTEVEKEAAVGLMLGDASLQTQNKGKTFRMKFE